MARPSFPASMNCFCAYVEKEDKVTWFPVPALF